MSNSATTAIKGKARKEGTLITEVKVQVIAALVVTFVAKFTGLFGMGWLFVKLLALSVWQFLTLSISVPVWLLFLSAAAGLIVVIVLLVKARNPYVAVDAPLAQLFNAKASLPTLLKSKKQIPENGRAVLVQNINADMGDYNQDSIIGITWRWQQQQERSTLVCYCPNCDRRIRPSEGRTPSYEFRASKPFVRFDCNLCGHIKTAEQDWDDVLDMVVTEIDLKERNGEWANVVKRFGSRAKT